MTTPGTDLAAYEPAQVEQYQPRMVMDPAAARALDDQLRQATRAVLREGTDYGIIPGTNGEKTLYRPGAQKLLQWFGLGITCERVDIERDDEGRKHGITYRATVTRKLPDGSETILATCEGTADYDESKFHQPVEQVKARLREQEHKWAAKDRRAPNADRWNSAKEYRADWNALMKRAQKRAIVGATVDATAAGGIFSDREEDEAPVAQDDGPGYYGKALEAALTFTDTEQAGELWRESAAAARDGLCTPNQATHIQNRIRQRISKLQAAVVVEVEDLGQEPAVVIAPDEDTAAAAAEAVDRHRKLVGAVQGHMKRLGYAVDDSDRDERMNHLAMIAGISSDLASTSDFDEDELKTIADTLARCKNRAALDTLLTAGETGE